MEANTKVTDLTYLTKAMYGDKKLIKEVLKIFISKFLQEIINLNDSIKEENYHNIQLFCKEIKPSISLLGISSLNERVLTIETFSVINSAASLMKLIMMEIHEIGNQAIEEIKEELKKY